MSGGDPRELLLKVIARFDHYTGTTNAKAALVAAFNTFVVGGIVLKWTEIVTLFSGHPHATRAAGVLFSTAALAALGSLGAVFFAVAPYLRSPKSPGTYHSLLFFQHVAEHSSGEAYKQALTKASEDDVLTDLATQAHSLAKGLRWKFRCMQVAIWALIAELGALAIVLLIKLGLVIFS